MWHGRLGVSNFFFTTCILLATPNVTYKVCRFILVIQIRGLLWECINVFSQLRPMAVFVYKITMKAAECRLIFAYDKIHRGVVNRAIVNRVIREQNSQCWSFSCTFMYYPFLEC